MHLFESASQAYVQKEKFKARKLKASLWWKRKLSEGVCYYCETKFNSSELTMEHKVPLSRGGRSSRSNVVISCKPCNSQKMYWTPAEIILNSKTNEEVSSVEREDQENCNK